MSWEKNGSLPIDLLFGPNATNNNEPSNSASMVEEMRHDSAIIAAADVANPSAYGCDTNLLSCYAEIARRISLLTTLLFCFMLLLICVACIMSTACFVYIFHHRKMATTCRHRSLEQVAHLHTLSSVLKKFSYLYDHNFS